MADWPKLGVVLIRRKH